MMLRPLSSRITSNTIFLLALHLICLVQSRSFYGTPDEFISMGDIDWGKRNIGSTMGKRNVASALRSYRSPYKRYESPAWAYSSMADTDWGWKKRSSSMSPDDDTDMAAELYKIYRGKKLTGDYWKRYGQSYYQPFGGYYQPYSPYSSQGRSSSYDPEPALPRSLAVAAPKTNNLKDRKYAFHSMADMDWGWKRKRSMAPALVDVDYDENDEELPSAADALVDKKSISSLHGKRSQVENDVNGVVE